MATATATPTTPTIHSADLRDLIERKADVTILDVRTGGEFDTVHIPGSFNVPLDRVSEYARELASVERPVVLVCQSGNRASQACTCLTEAGKDSIQVLQGGIAAWEAEGGNVVRGKERWAMDRQVRLVAGSLVLTGIAASIFAPKAKYLAGAIGAGLTFSAVSNTCAMAQMLSKLPYNRTDDTCDVPQVIAEMGG